MKTVKDVYAAYKEWPIGMTHAISSDDNGISFISHIGNLSLSNAKSCTREEYEQYKEKQESKNMKASWYDYDKGEAISLPPVGCECEAALSFDPRGSSVNFNTIEVLYADKSTVVGRIIKGAHTGNYSNGFETDLYKFRPLDHDKHAVKAVPMEWMIKCGLDVEFSTDGNVWYLAQLVKIGDSKYPYDCNGDNAWKHCRPRMNHPQFMTVAQFELIPKDVFNLSLVVLDDDVFGKYYIVEFTGLKDGYKFAHEVEW